jgi:hypothetical protein
LFSKVNNSVLAKDETVFAKSLQGEINLKYLRLFTFVIEQVRISVLRSESSALAKEISRMSTDSSSTKPEPKPITPEVHHIQRVVIVQYPKVVFLLPSMITALIAGLFMAFLGIDLNIPGRPEGASAFMTKQNLIGVIFLLVFTINLIAMSVDFPRYSALALLFGGTTLGLIFLIVNDRMDLIGPLKRIVSEVYIVANATFYFLFALILMIVYVIVYATRWMDYWEVRPNEIIHNHGPLSDQIRYPTFGLKFDKEIPDILEYMLLGSGRLVFKVPSENRSIVLENVLWIDRKEKQLMEVLGEMAVRLEVEEHNQK